MINFKNIKIFTFLVCIFSFLFFIFYFTNAQAQPQFLVSWQANSYAPSWYEGKIFPSHSNLTGFGNPVRLNFELIDNGKIVDLSKTIVRWYVNDHLVKNEDNGLGIKSLNFLDNDSPGNETEIRIILPNYKGGSIEKIIKIPVVEPEAVIDASYPDAKINVGSSNFQVYPFFFNIKDLSDLSVEWSVMGQKIENVNDPWRLNLNIDQKTPAGTEINLSVLVKNLSKELELVRKNLKLIIQ